ncbi:CCR4-NOT transcription complex, subunit 6-like protein [Dunaliella salina]|uniref:CCR4-NOT transcription complex, subunit 6-like protein n=1 Tax=Dunaliella salina TaxID=3046 RepID=A0ABQ7GDL8_DUNSA|nr:CCR4-NOT transcription complex, subunit 6-like protein [Dunaliella salina]|eukprot:KAF5832704.1 CCR4-NOT transcription complex, subunit 6-like protein [Dunaliella salina]
MSQERMVISHDGKMGNMMTKKATQGTFKCLSFNVLANKYATGGGHSYCPAPALAWPHRWNLIKMQLSKQWDVVCLQEVEQQFFLDDLQPFMNSMGLQGWHYTKQDGRDAEGLAMFYNSSSFKCHAARQVCLADCLPSSNAAESTDNLKEGGPSPPGAEALNVLQKQRASVIIALLEHATTGQALVAACTHLFWDPRWPDVKALQASLLCQQLASWVQGPNPVPIVLGGDFNSLWRKYKPDAFDAVIPTGPQNFLTSGVYQLLSGGELPTSHHDHPVTRRHATAAVSMSQPPSSLSVLWPLCTAPLTSSGIQLQSVYSAFCGKEPDITTRTATFSGCLDYIWITPQKLDVLDVLPVEDQGPIPNDQNASDHLPIGATLAFKS